MSSLDSRLADLDRRLAEDVESVRSVDEVLEVYSTYWAEACATIPDFPSADWLTDLESDIELARVLNGLRKHS